MKRIVDTPDGLLLAVEDCGDPAGWPVLVHHGSPSSRHSAFYGPYVRDAAERGLRLIGYDSPAHIPGVEARLLDDGHASIVNRVPEVHAWLSEHP